MAHGLLAVLDANVDDCAIELEALEPFAQAMPTQWCLATSRVLGLLAHAAGHRRRAITHFEASLALCRANGFTPELAWTCHDYAATLLRVWQRSRSGPGSGPAGQKGSTPSRHLALPGSESGLPHSDSDFAPGSYHKPADLTARELEVLQLLVEGRTNKAIAQTLFISVHAVNLHVARVLHKTGTSNRTEAAAFAARQHLVERSF